MDELIVNGEVTIPLYHGTSSIFLKSIEYYGLGGINIIEKFRVLEYFSNIFEACEITLSGNTDWETCKFVPEMLLNQISTGDSTNYQHGDTYLSPSRGTAVSYALTNHYGSELISNANRLFSFVKERKPDLLESKGLANHPLQTFFEQSSIPILLRIKNLRVINLASESGGSPEKTLETIKGVLPFLNAPGTSFNFNFRLLHSIPFDACEVEYLDPQTETNLFAW